MLETMNVRVEVWPVAADRVGIWLLSGDDAWRSGNVMADNEPHQDLEFILSDHEALDRAVLVHSTSWRVEGPAVILTYVVVIRHSGLVRDDWPEALPVSLELAETVGKPLANSPVEPPTPRYIDVLLHGIRHLRFLLDTDSANAAALDDQWRTYLAALDPALAGMYRDQEREV